MGPRPPRRTVRIHPLLLQPRRDAGVPVLARRVLADAPRGPTLPHLGAVRGGPQGLPENGCRRHGTLLYMILHIYRTASGEILFNPVRDICFLFFAFALSCPLLLVDPAVVCYCLLFMIQSGAEQSTVVRCGGQGRRVGVEKGGGGDPMEYSFCCLLACLSDSSYFFIVDRRQRMHACMNASCIYFPFLSKQTGQRSYCYYSTPNRHHHHHATPHLTKPCHKPTLGRSL